MSIPNIQMFQDFLAGLELTEQDGSSGYLNEIAIPESVAQDTSGEVPEKEYRLWFKPVNEFTLESLVRCVQRELEATGHKTQRNATLALLCFFCIHPERRSAPVQTLNNLLARIVDGDVSQFLVVHGRPPSIFQDFRFGSFAFGKLDSQRLSYRAKKADSDFFERWQDGLKGRLAIERDICPVRIVDWISIKAENRAAIFSTREVEALWKRVMEAYFHFISVAYFDEFWQQFVEQQELQVAAGAPFIGDRELRLLPSSAISIYLNIGKRWGFVAPHGLAYLTMNFGGVDAAVPRTIERLHKEFGISQLGEGELHQTIRSYVRFVCKAKRHLIDKRHAEAYLHFIIALDLLFGDREGLTRNITKRVALIVYSKLGVAFQEAVKVVSNMYDVRSRYVHQGETTGMSDIQTVQTICEEVLCCLLRMQKYPEKNRPGAINEWRGSLDYFITAKETNRTISNSDLNANGIIV